MEAASEPRPGDVVRPPPADDHAREADPDPHDRIDATLTLAERLHSDLRAADELVDDLSLKIDDVLRRAAIWELLAPRLAGAPGGWSEVFDGLGEEEWSELARLVGDRDLAELLTPVEPPAPTAGRQRWAGTSDHLFPVVVPPRAERT